MKSWVLQLKLELVKGAIITFLDCRNRTLIVTQTTKKHPMGSSKFKQGPIGCSDRKRIIQKKIKIQSTES